MSTHSINIERIYALSLPKKGVWLLVDRLWPRGIKKEDIALDAWLKDIAPSTSLRQWFNHDPAKWPEFRHRYLQELKGKAELMELILAKAQKTPVTLLYAAKDKQHNNALILRDFLGSWPHLPSD